MKNWCLPILVVVLFLSVVSADSGLEVEKVDKGNIIISDFGTPAHYNLIINNLGETDSFKIFTLVGVTIDPSDYRELPPGNTTVPITAYMSDKILRERNGLLYFEYQIKGRHRDLFIDKLLVNIVDLEDILEFTYSPLQPSDSTAEILVKNKENVEIKNLTVVFDSVFFRDSYTFDLAANGSRKFSILLNKEGKDRLVAGPYIVEATILTPNGDKKIGGLIDFLEKEGTSVAEDSSGIIVRKHTVQKTNVGNTAVTATISMKKDVFSRLFTTSSIEPTEVTREGFFVIYTWRKTVSPGESFAVTSSTNYTFPFLIILAIIVIGYLARAFYLRSVSIHKKVSFVRTRGGEFALKVTLKVRARKSVEKLQLTDTLPGMTKLFENFGKKPDQIDHNSRRLVWHIGSLGRGEERVYSYVMYSKLNVVGRFELPLAHASYELNGKTDHVYSNQAFFAAEKD